MKFWGGSGSGSADPCLWLMDPAIFVIDLQDDSKKLIFNTIFSAYYFLKVHLHHFSKIRSQKESQNSRNQGFSYFFCMMIEGSGSRSRAASGTDPDLYLWLVDPNPGGPKTCGSNGSGFRSGSATLQWRTIVSVQYCVQCITTHGHFFPIEQSAFSETSVVDPDPVGSGIFCLSEIHYRYYTIMFLQFIQFYTQ